MYLYKSRSPGLLNVNKTDLMCVWCIRMHPVHIPFMQVSRSANSSLSNDWMGTGVKFTSIYQNFWCIYISKGSTWLRDIFNALGIMQYTKRNRTQQDVCWPGRAGLSVRCSYLNLTKKLSKGAFRRSLKISPVQVRSTLTATCRFLGETKLINSLEST